LGQPTGFVFGKHQFIIRDDIEDAVFTGNELGFGAEGSD